MSTNRFLVRTSLSVLISYILAMPALAADDEQNDDNDAVLEEVTVVGTMTGTSIRGVAPIGSSLIEVGREDIDRSSATTAIKLLRETPQIFTLGVNDTSRNGSGGSGNIVYGNALNIRGIGPYATLTLINGRHAIPQGTLGATVDPTVIPMIALERVEVVADGNSAVYGSDAIAGVANLITRRGYDGVGVDLQYGWADSYDENQIGAIAGKTWEGGQFTMAAQRSFRGNLLGADRSFYRSDLTPWGGTDYRVTTCNPGNIYAGGTSYAIPAGGASESNLVPGTLNECDNLPPTTDLMPEMTYVSAIANFDQDLGERFSIFADVLYYTRDGHRSSEPYDARITVPETNAFFVAPAGVALSPCPGSAGVPAGTGCESVEYSFIGVYGPAADSDYTTDTWQATAGFDVDLFSDWKLEVYGTAGENEELAFSVGNNVNSGNLAAALRSSDPATAFNPFGTGSNSDAVIAKIFDYATETPADTKIQEYVAKADGSLFSIPGGEVKMAVGVGYYEIKMRTGQVRGPAGNRTGTDNRYSRDITSAFLEAFVPIIGDGNAMTGAQSLVLNLAVRTDDYSDVGRTTNPKIGVNWEPTQDVLVHASYGESFRAPGLTQLVSAGGSYMYVQNYFDPTVNKVVRGVAQSGGNLDLNPETAKTYSFGIDFTPESMNGARFSVNYFDIEYIGQIGGQLANLNILRQEDTFSSIIWRDAEAQAITAALYASGIGVRSGTVDEALNTPVFVDGRNNNLGGTDTRGLDFAISVPIEANSGDWTVGLQGTWFDYYKVSQTAEDTPKDRVNNIDYPMSLRMRGSVNWQRNGWDVTGFVNYINSYDNVLTGDKISSQSLVDLSASYTFEGSDRDFLNGLRVGVFVDNIFDEDPPFVDIAPTNNGGGGFDPQVANPLGRLISVAVSKQF